MKTSGVMLLLATLLAHTGYAAAEAPNVRPPVNATAQSYGTWWTCNIGYRKADNTCVSIQLPPHAVLNDHSYGRGWECIWGYRESYERCEQVPVPQNAYLASADRWECERGYQRVRHNCIAIEVPEHRYLAEPGRKCEREYGLVREACITITEVSPNAFPTDATPGSG